MEYDNTPHPEEPNRSEDQPTCSPTPSPPPPPKEVRYEYIPTAAALPMEDRRDKKRFSIWRVFWGVITFFSILANLILFFVILALGVSLFGRGGVGSANTFAENVLREGNVARVIAVINIDDVIDPAMSDRVRRQLDAAADNDNVKAVIVRIVSPGGYVSSSDQIYYEITRFRERTGKPAVAFMQTVAASGGYYSAVACDKIIAEPTVITGSIGVIMNHIVFQNLLEEKLGISPVVIKSGPKKDWPSYFAPVTEEQRQYIADKLIQPSFERFLEVIAEGRSEVLSMEEIRQLADGSIYYAQEAMDKKLIDQIGYVGDAIALTEELAGIQNARVVEYMERFTFLQALTAQGQSSRFKLDRSTLHKLTTPELMYYWDGRP
jgi:protease-4